MIFLRGFILLTLLTCSNLLAEEYVKHEIYGKYPASEQSYFDELTKYDDDINYITEYLGLGQLPVLYSSFRSCPGDDKNLCKYGHPSPRYATKKKYLLLANAKNEKPLMDYMIAPAIHEVGHAVYYQFLYVKMGLNSFNEVKNNYVIHSFLSGEFFSDLFASLILDDPSVLAESIPKSFASDRTLWRVHQGATKGIPYRVFSYNNISSSKSCDSDKGLLASNSHHMLYSCLRKYIWNELYVKRFKREKSSVPIILEATLSVVLKMAEENNRRVNHFISEGKGGELTRKQVIAKMTPYQRDYVKENNKNYFIDHRGFDRSFIKILEQEFLN